MRLAFTVYGVAQPKGSMKSFLVKTKATGMKVPIVTDSNRSVKAWSQLVAQGASAALGRLGPDAALLTGGVQVHVRFWLPRPKGLPRKVTQHTKRPDLDKLVRAVLDALTGVVWHDDGQVCEVLAAKHYAEATGACVQVQVRPASIGAREVVVVGSAPLSRLLGLDGLEDEAR